MGAIATGGYRCCYGSDQPSFVLSMFAQVGVAGLPEFKLRMPVVDSASYSSGIVEETLCGYVAHNLEGFLEFGHNPFRYYRLVYRRAKNGSGGGTLPSASASARPNDDDVIEGSVESEQEESRLLATEESRQRYGLRGEDH